MCTPVSARSLLPLSESERTHSTLCLTTMRIQLLERVLRRRARTQGASKAKGGGAMRSSRAHAGNAAVGYSSNAGSTKSEYRKDSTDRQRWALAGFRVLPLSFQMLTTFLRNSLITQALFQEAQQERIRAADRDGKDEVTYLAANVSAPTALEWTVTCDLEFYSKAYGTIAGCTPSAPAFCRRIVHDSFAPEEHCQVLREATEDAMRNLFHRSVRARAACSRGARRVSNVL